MRLTFPFCSSTANCVQAGLVIYAINRLISPTHCPLRVVHVEHEFRTLLDEGLDLLELGEAAVNLRQNLLLYLVLCVQQNGFGYYTTQQ